MFCPQQQRAVALYAASHSSRKQTVKTVCEAGGGRGDYDLGLAENAGKRNSHHFPSVSSPRHARSNAGDKLECSYQL